MARWRFPAAAVTRPSRGELFLSCVRSAPACLFQRRYTGGAVQAERGVRPPRRQLGGVETGSARGGDARHSGGPALLRVFARRAARSFLDGRSRRLGRQCLCSAATLLLDHDRRRRAYWTGHRPYRRMDGLRRYWHRLLWHAFLAPSAEGFDQMWQAMVNQSLQQQVQAMSADVKGAERFPQPAAFAGGARRTDADRHAFAGTCPDGIRGGRRRAGRASLGAIAAARSLKSREQGIGSMEQETGIPIPSVPSPSVPSP